MSFKVMFVSATVLASSIVGVAGQSQRPQSMPEPERNTATQATESKAMNPDHQFVMEAAMGGMTEVELSKLAVEKATNARVKTFGQQMVTDHGKANDELKTLASS